MSHSLPDSPINPNATGKSTPSRALLQRSSLVHQIAIDRGRILVVHAVSDRRWVVDEQVNAIINYFADARENPSRSADLYSQVPQTSTEIDRVIAGLAASGILTEKSPEEERQALSTELFPTYGRNPSDMLDRYRRALKEGVSPYWTLGMTADMTLASNTKATVHVLVFGDCDVQMEAEFLRREAGQHGIDLHVAATFVTDIRLATEHRHDAIIIGALPTRHGIIQPTERGRTPHAYYIEQARTLIEELRSRSAAPILIDNLPEPTVQPLGLAERGTNGHRTRFKAANVALAQLVEPIPNVYIIDAAAAIAAAGSERMVDDGQVGFTHLGSPGWMLQRPTSEKEAVHGRFPDMLPLAQMLDGDPYGRETVMARMHVGALRTICGIDRKKCVIVDLDGTLWPGVLAETGAPFAWKPEICSPFSFIGLYFGLHEALLCLKKRGIVLACISKNDEATVRELWNYPSHYPCQRLVKWDDLVSWRINWIDKSENIRSIADELGFALESILFIDDHPVERDRVRHFLPEVEVWGDDMFGLRRRLLGDPRLQVPTISPEAGNRTILTKSRLERERARLSSADEEQFRASLEVECVFANITDPSRVVRIEELFRRTTQFNTSAYSFSLGELTEWTNRKPACMFSVNVSDRFGDQGLVGAAVAIDDEILGIAISCRVLGLGIEDRFIQYVLAELKKHSSTIRARIVETSRNAVVRNIYQDNGFREVTPGQWQIEFQ